MRSVFFFFLKGVSKIKRPHVERRFPNRNIDQGLYSFISTVVAANELASLVPGGTVSSMYLWS